MQSINCKAFRHLLHIYSSYHAVISDHTRANQSSVNNQLISETNYHSQEGFTATWHSCCSQPCHVQATTQNALF